MAKGSVKPTFTKNILCMGCGKYFNKRAVELIEGVPFCAECKSAGGEFRMTIQAERETLRNLQGLPEGDKWEQAWSSKGMINLTPERLAKFPHPIPLEGIEAGLPERVCSRLLDYFFASFGVILLDAFFHLTVVTGWIFGDLGLAAGDYQYPSLLDPMGRDILWEHPAVAKKVFLLVIIVIGLYRLSLVLTIRRTLGESFAGIMLTTPSGRFPGFGSRFLKVVVTTLSDAALIGPLVDGVVYLLSRPPVSASDAIANMRAVRYEPWKATAIEMIHRLSITRTGA